MSPTVSCHMEEEPMIYEVRTYTLRPGAVAEFEERFAKRLPLREKHSKIRYHPQSGWFDEGPQRGPATRGKGLKAL